MLKLFLRSALPLLAVLVFNGCAVMAVRTGVKAERRIEERIQESQSGAAGQESQAQRPRLINRPGLLRHEQEQAATNSAGTNAME